MSETQRNLEKHRKIDLLISRVAHAVTAEVHNFFVENPITHLDEKWPSRE